MSTSYELGQLNLVMQKYLGIRPRGDKPDPEESLHDDEVATTVIGELHNCFESIYFRKTEAFLALVRCLEDEASSFSKEGMPPTKKAMRRRQDLVRYLEEGLGTGSMPTFVASLDRATDAVPNAFSPSMLAGLRVLLGEDETSRLDNFSLLAEVFIAWGRRHLAAFPMSPMSPTSHIDNVYAINRPRKEVSSLPGQEGHE